MAKDGNTSSPYYILSSTDARGLETFTTLGNNKNEERVFDRASGDLKSIQAGTLPGTPNIQNLSFTYDEVGNLKTRTNAIISKTETLTYDELHRLA